MFILSLALAGVTLAAAFLTAALLQARQQLRKESNEHTLCRQSLSALNQRFGSVVSIESEMQRVTTEFRLTREKQVADMEALRAAYSKGMERHEQLTRAIGRLEESLEAVEVGLYSPHFTYEDSESYKDALQSARDAQKRLVKEGRAAVCAQSWTVGNSAREGARMVKQMQSLYLRAFNAESEAAIANVTWKNFATMEARIWKSFDALNKLGTVLQISLTDEYRDSRLAELRLVFEEAELRQREKEEQKRIRAAQREEERVQRELQREQEDAAKEEDRLERTLEKVRGELDTALAAERDAMLARIKALEADLASAHDRKERAIAQAQLTKVGHVYIISNIGAFGEEVLKIGLTRRLDPIERIDELGDASVPFPFDCHALIYSENAPELEARLHNHFWEKRLNWANDRKEFFRVTIADVQRALAEIGLSAELRAVPEAREYRQTLAIRHPASRGTEPVTVAQAALSLPRDPFAPESGQLSEPDPRSNRRSQV